MTKEQELRQILTDYENDIKNKDDERTPAEKRNDCIKIIMSI